MNKATQKTIGRFTIDGIYFVGGCPSCKHELYFTREQAAIFMANCYEVPNKLDKLKYAFRPSDSAILTLGEERM